jgi:hypothetical protein
LGDYIERIVGPKVDEDDLKDRLRLCTPGEAPGRTGATPVKPAPLVMRTVSFSNYD